MRTRRPTLQLRPHAVRTDSLERVHRELPLFHVRLESEPFRQQRPKHSTPVRAWRLFQLSPRGRNARRPAAIRGSPGFSQTVGHANQLPQRNVDGEHPAARLQRRKDLHRWVRLVWSSRIRPRTSLRVPDCANRQRSAAAGIRQLSCVQPQSLRRGRRLVEINRRPFDLAERGHAQADVNDCQQTNRADRGGWILQRGAFHSGERRRAD